MKSEKYFFALVRAESVLCGTPRSKSDVSGLAPQDHAYALLVEIWRLQMPPLSKSKDQLLFVGQSFKQVRHRRR